MINGTDYWYDTMDKKQLHLATFLDPKKAFDTMDMNIDKNARCIRYRGNLESMVLNLCSVDGQTLRARLVTCGIPQGSCLGSLLFIIYLHDFENFLEFYRASMYADDTHVTLASNNVIYLITNVQR